LILLCPAIDNAALGETAAGTDWAKSAELTADDLESLRHFIRSRAREAESYR
jgi:hypothetical protein